MCVFGVDLIEYGCEFQDSCEYVQCLVCEQQLYMIFFFYCDLVVGVLIYWMELFVVQFVLDVVLVFIGQGLGMCVVVVVCNVLGFKMCIIGVVLVYVLVYKFLFEVGCKIEVLVLICIVDGVVCCVLDQVLLDVMFFEVDEVVVVIDDEVMDVMKLVFIVIYNVVEGVGVCVLVVVLQLCIWLCGKKIGVMFFGGNVDYDVFVGVLVCFSVVVDVLLVLVQVVLLVQVV